MKIVINKEEQRLKKLLTSGNLILKGESSFVELISLRCDSLKDTKMELRAFQENFPFVQKGDWIQLWNQWWEVGPITKEYILGYVSSEIEDDCIFLSEEEFAKISYLILN